MSGNRVLGALRVAWMLLACAMLVPPSATAQAMAPSAAPIRLAQLEHDVAALRALAQQRLGPFELHTQCTYCKHDLLGICAEQATEARSRTVDFSAPREQLDATLAQAQQDAATIARHYAPAQAWIDGLASFSARFDSAADVVLGIEQAIRKGDGPNEQQRRDATQALLALTGELGRSAMQLDAGVNALHVAIGLQSGYRTAIREAIGGSEQAARTAWRDLEQASQQAPCKDSPEAGFNAVRSDFTRAMLDVAGDFDRLEAGTRSGEKALAGLSDAVTSARSEVESVLRLLAAAGSDQLDSFLGRLHLAAAKRQWNELAKAVAP